MTARLWFPLHTGQNTLSLAGHKEGCRKLIKSAKIFFFFPKNKWSFIKFVQTNRQKSSSEMFLLSFSKRNEARFHIGTTKS